MKDAILYRARSLNPIVQREIDRLSRELPDFRLFVICFQPEYESARDSDREKVFYYGQRDLYTLPYPGKLSSIDLDQPLSRPPSEAGNGKYFREMEPGQHDLALMRFFLDHPDFDRYWMIEDDVRCSGPWTDIIGELAQSKADLLMTIVQKYREKPHWYWWNTLNTAGETVPPSRRIRGFTPFCRLSAACCRAIDQKYRQGWGGHYEVTWPSIARASGLSIEDIGGRGSFTPRKRRGRLYTSSNLADCLFPGTFVFRPAYQDTGKSEFCDDILHETMLWHPVKS
ncbi:MAG: hypothetical protein WBP85_02405 [Terracidiphilus sp.]